MFENIFTILQYLNVQIVQLANFKLSLFKNYCNLDITI